MAHLVIDRRANRFGIGLVTRRRVIQGGGDGVLNLGDVVVGQLIELIGGHAHLHMGGQKVQNF